MGLTRILYLLLLVAVGAGRLIELRISARNRERMSQRGAVRVAEPGFHWMVALHTGFLVSAALEVFLLRRPFIPALAISMGALFLFATCLRWWVIQTLAGHWNAQVMNSVKLGVITRGPYRWVRHPNYLAVIIEMFSLPLIHTAYLTAIWATLVNAWILHSRLAVEEGVLLADPAYRAAMAPKARFFPGIF
jgi:methyltransferase